MVIGSGGRIPPTVTIEDDASGDVDTSGTFDPATDGIDFYESLEGMLVQVNDAVAVGPTRSSSNKEIPVVGDSGANAGPRTARGGLLLTALDANPEPITLDTGIGGPALPSVNVGATFPGATTGVVDYSAGLFKLLVATLPAVVPGPLGPEAVSPAGVNQLAVGTLNLGNLDPADGTRFTDLAALIVNRLASPDIIAVQDLQDNNGVTNDAVVDASTTLGMLVTAIGTAGGPTYQYRQIDPVDDQDGGEAGGNARQAFLFRTDRGLSFIDRPGGTATTAISVVGSGGGTQLSSSPGRIDPANAAFSQSQKPLAAEFSFNGHHVFVIAVQFLPRTGDNPLFGRFQPPVLTTQAQRIQQADVVHDFVEAIQAASPTASVVVLGNVADTEYSPTMDALQGSPAILDALVETLPADERYNTVADGNSQAVDHVLVAPSLSATRPLAYDIVHATAEFATRTSDQDAPILRITLNDPPTISAGGPYSVNEGGTVAIGATGLDPENGPLTYAWDLDNNGSFETAGQSVVFSAGALDGPATATVNARVTDNGGLAATISLDIAVLNVAPSNVQAAPVASFVNENGTAVLNGSFADPGPLDEHQVVIDWGDATPQTTLTLGAGILTFSASHVYTDDDPSGTSSDVYAISVSVVELSRARTLPPPANGSTSVTIRNLVPSPTIIGAPASSPASVSIDVTSSVTDPGPRDTIALEWSVTRSGFPYASGTGPAFSFTPDTNGTYLLLLQATDDDTGTQTTRRTITVTKAAERTTTQKGSLLVFPDIDVRGGQGFAPAGKAAGPEVTTIVRIQNDATSGVWVKCHYMDGQKRRNDFAFLVTRGQPIWFDAATGAGTVGANPFPSGFGAGMLACFATMSDESTQIRWNHLSGTATVVNYTQGTAYRVLRLGHQRGDRRRRPADPDAGRVPAPGAVRPDPRRTGLHADARGRRRRARARRQAVRSVPRDTDRPVLARGCGPRHGAGPGDVRPDARGVRGLQHGPATGLPALRHEARLRGLEPERDQAHRGS